MSELPRGWAEATLGEIGEYLNGRGFKRSEWREAGRPIIRIQNLTGTSDRFNYFDGEPEENYTVRSGDLLVSWAATLGVFVWKGPEAVVNQHIFKVRSHIDREFHRYVLLSVLDDLRRQTHGSGMVHITKARFEQTAVAIPPLAEQRRIVAAIEEQFSRVDAGDASLRAAQRKCAVLRKSALALVDNTDGKLVSLRDILGRSTLFTDGDWVESKDQDPSGSIRLIQLADIGEGVFRDRSSRFLNEETATRLQCTYLAPGDVLVARMADPLGRACIFPRVGQPAVTAVDVCIIRPESADLDRRWLVYALNAPRARREMETLASGTTRKRISRKNLSRVTLKLLSPDEQRRIVAEVEQHLSIVDAIVAEVGRALRRSAALRRSILEQAFTGSLVPQDPSDEPVSALLERIVAQRAATPKPSRRKRKTPA